MFLCGERNGWGSRPYVLLPRFTNNLLYQPNNIRSKYFTKFSSSNWILFYTFCISLSTRASQWLAGLKYIWPTLFLIFINDLGNFETSDHKLFSDVIQLFRPISCKNDTPLLQEDLEGLRSWSKNNTLPLNCNERFIIKFTRKRNWIYVDYAVSGTKL